MLNVVGGSMSHSVEEDAVPKIAAEFILETTIDPVICDGCNVRGNWEHRCHGARSVVQGEQTNKQCQCPDCFVVNELGIS